MQARLPPFSLYKKGRLSLLETGMEVQWFNTEGYEKAHIFKNIGLLTKMHFFFFVFFLSLFTVLLMNLIKNVNCFQVVIDLGDEETEKTEEIGDWGSYLLLLIALSFPLSPAITLHFEALIDRTFQAIQKSMSHKRAGWPFPNHVSFWGQMCHRTLVPLPLSPVAMSLYS